MSHRFVATLFLALYLLVLGGCSLYRDDRMWISEDKYKEAETVYSEKKTIEATRTELDTRLGWRHAEINEAIYRLQKLHDIE
jgi:hypothetical protein